MNMMKANILRTCGKANRRVAALFITLFLKTHKVKNKYIVVGGKEEEVVPVMEFINTESKISRWISESVRYVAEISPIGGVPPPTSDPIYEKSTNRRPKSSEVAPGENSQDYGEWCEDYSILKIAY
ncbi:hypothetical protein ScPMuIL_001854 [Solemya velum]